MKNPYTIGVVLVTIWIGVKYVIPSLSIQSKIKYPSYEEIVNEELEKGISFNKIFLGLEFGDTEDTVKRKLKTSDKIYARYIEGEWWYMWYDFDSMYVDKVNDFKIIGSSLVFYSYHKDKLYELRLSVTHETVGYGHYLSDDKKWDLTYKYLVSLYKEKYGEPEYVYVSYNCDEQIGSKCKSYDCRGDNIKYCNENEIEQIDEIYKEFYFIDGNRQIKLEVLMDYRIWITYTDLKIEKEKSKGELEKNEQGINKYKSDI